MELFETKYLPVAEVPKGDGWEMISGNATHNSWRRPGPLMIAATRVLDALAKVSKLPPEVTAMAKQLETALTEARK
jgi:hypothetical protein